MLNQTECYRQFTSERMRKEVKFRFNKPFSVDPLTAVAKNVKKGNPWNQVESLEIPLTGIGDSRGFIVLEPKLDSIPLKYFQEVLLPMGKPHIDLSIDPVKGEIIGRSLPLSIIVGAGPVHSDDIKHARARIHMLFMGTEYIGGEADSVPFQYESEPRMMIARTWINKKSGRIGPVVLPSGADFRQIQFKVVKPHFLT